MNEFYGKNQIDSEEFAKKVAATIKEGDVIALNGGLGTGKTTLSKFICKALGVSERVTSPTFTIVQEYRSGRLPVFHFDVYRMSSSEELEDIGYEEYFFGGGVSIVEWAEIVEEVLPSNTKTILIEMGQSEEERIYKYDFDI